MKVFVCYSSADKRFVDHLALQLRSHGVEVWYDDWEIKVGDSIVEKVFDGLSKSDALIVVLSAESVKSRWVTEELNTAAIRRIDDNDILLLPVLREDCDIPTVLRQLRYADFRDDTEDALMELLDAIQPLRLLWQSLKLLREHHSLVSAQIKAANLDDLVEDQIDKLHELMSTALDIRCQIELRHARERAEHQDFFQKIGALKEKGLDIRSQTWNSLVSFRARMAHQARHQSASARMFASAFRDRYRSPDEQENLHRALDRLEELMRLICEESDLGFEQRR
jgi:hypothetical protein